MMRVICGGIVTPAMLSSVVTTHQTTHKTRQQHGQVEQQREQTEETHALPPSPDHLLKIEGAGHPHLGMAPVGTIRPPHDERFRQVRIAHERKK